MKTRFDLEIHRVKNIPKKVYLIGKVKRFNIVDFWTSGRFFEALIDPEYSKIPLIMNKFSEGEEDYDVFEYTTDNRVYEEVNSIYNKISAKLSTITHLSFSEECDMKEKMMERILIHELVYIHTVFEYKEDAFSVREYLKENDEDAKKHVYFVIEAEIPKDFLYIKRVHTVKYFKQKNNDENGSSSYILCEGLIPTEVISPTKEDLAMFWK